MDAPVRGLPCIGRPPPPLVDAPTGSVRGAAGTFDDAAVIVTVAVPCTLVVMTTCGATPAGELTADPSMPVESLLMPSSPGILAVLWLGMRCGWYGAAAPAPPAPRLPTKAACDVGVTGLSILIARPMTSRPEPAGYTTAEPPLPGATMPPVPPIRVSSCSAPGERDRPDDTPPRLV